MTTKGYLNERTMATLDWASDILVIINAIAIILFSYGSMAELYQEHWDWFLCGSTIFFIAEMILRVYHQRTAFFRSAWNILDLTIVIVSSATLMPSIMSLRLLRLFRILRLLRLFSINSEIRRVMASLALSFTRVLWTSIIILCVYCIYLVMGMEFFGKSFPLYFGTVGDAAFTLFQTMTLESWASGIARPITTHYPFAWIYFVSFIIISTYLLLSLMTSVITASVVEIYESKKESKRHNALEESLRQLTAQVERLAQRQEQDTSTTQESVPSQERNERTD